MNTVKIQRVADSLRTYQAVSVDLATRLAKQYFGRYKDRRGSNDLRTCKSIT